MSFDYTVEILKFNADALVFRGLHMIAKASSIQFATVPFVNATCAKDKNILKTTGQKIRTITWENLVISSGLLPSMLSAFIM